MPLVMPAREAAEQITSGELSPEELMERQQDLEALERVLDLLDGLEANLGDPDEPLEEQAESN